MRKSKNTFGELYQVKINYKKQDGFWEYGKIVDVIVDVEHGRNEKCNHERAEAKVLKLFPNCEIVHCYYC